MYISTWIVVFAVLMWAWGQYNWYRQVTVLRGCYLEMSDWTQEIAQELDRTGGCDRCYEEKWEALVRRHGTLQRRRGISLRKSWAEYDIRFEKA